jgi:hypothetical protein
MECKDKRKSLFKRKKRVHTGGGYRQLSDKERKKVSKKISKLIEEGQVPAKTGLFLTRDSESLPVFGPIGEAEEVMARDSSKGKFQGARIVLTKDNYGHRGTGLGGMGGTSCEAIDLVAGTLTCQEFMHDDQMETRANFITDGARIYLTERGDVQNYFALNNTAPESSVSSMLKSGIGIKADHTVIIGRERVKIVAGFSFAEPKGTERLANMATAETAAKPQIEIGATTSESFQPAVLGDNLVNYLRKVSDNLLSLNDYTQQLENKILNLQLEFASHFHSGAGLGYIQTFPDPKLIPSAMSNVGQTIQKTTEKIMSEMQRYLDEAESLGIDGAIDGAPDKTILSTTVKIGN